MNNTNTPLNFWSQIWQEGTIRFHQAQYNSQMMSFFQDIDLTNKSVLIPLAGKTNDILYFLKRGAKVTAIEFVEQAVIDFFNDNKIEYAKNGNAYHYKNLTFCLIDFFKFKTEQKFDVLYDRAGQVVFSPDLRESYYQHIETLIHKKTILFLAAIDHSGPDDYGPPFKISPDEVIGVYKKMGIDLVFFSQKSETSSEKMQAIEINSLNSYFLASRNF